MSKTFGVLVAVLVGSVVGCAADDQGESASTDSALHGYVTSFHPVQSCAKRDYVGEVDFTDRRHPRYRIRHSDASRGLEVGKQNIGLILARGETFPRRGWASPDALVSVYADMHTPALKEESDRTVPWRDLSVSEEFLDLAFDDKGDRLQEVEFRYNVPHFFDPFCQAFFGAE